MKKFILLFVILVFIGIGVVLASQKKSTPAPTQTKKKVSRTLPKNTEVSVELKKSSKANTVDLWVTKLNKKYTGISYEITYESQGLVKGVNSGTKPIETSGAEEFTREVYLGTCSRNVCKPDTGVSKVSVTLELTDTSGTMTQFTQEYPVE